jgi:hypothetical protein
MDIDDLLDLAPAETPKFVLGDITWPNVTLAAQYMRMSAQGFMKYRQRFEHAYEHRHMNNTYVHFPSWIRLYKINKLARG